MTTPFPHRFDPATFDFFNTRDSTVEVQAFTEGIGFLHQWIFNLCAPHFGQHILEIGPGCGALVQQLIDGQQFEDYLGLELNPHYANLLREIYKHQTNVAFCQGDFLNQEIPLAAGGFDSVVAISCLEHLADDRTAILRMKKLVRPGGKIILYCPAIPVLYNIGDHLAGHYRRYDKTMLKALAIHAGMNMIVLRYCNLPGVLSWLSNGKRVQKGDFLQQIIPPVWLTRLIIPYLRMENRLALPIGLNLFCVMEKQMSEEPGQDYPPPLHREGHGE